MKYPRKDHNKQKQQDQLETIYQIWRWIGMNNKEIDWSLLNEYENYKKLSKMFGFHDRLVKEFNCEDCYEE